MLFLRVRLRLANFIEASCPVGKKLLIVKQALCFHCPVGLNLATNKQVVSSSALIAGKGRFCLSA